VGPSLDESTLGRARIVEIVTNGRGGMPSFAGRLSGEEIERIAAFVAEQRCACYLPMSAASGRVI
jgi:mono/diheme cytochrome c family protein